MSTTMVASPSSDISISSAMVSTNTMTDDTSTKTPTSNLAGQIVEEPERLPSAVEEAAAKQWRIQS